MSYGFGFGALVPLLLFLPVIAGQWIGILGLAKANRSGDWWCMLIGVLLTTAGGLFSITISLGMVVGYSGSALLGSIQTIIALSACSGLGSVLFAAGFAIHGQKAAKNSQRKRELESIAEAEEELTRSAYEAGK